MEKLTAEDERGLLLALANAIEQALKEDQDHFGEFEDSLPTHMWEQDPRLENRNRYWGAELRALWNFSDTYFHQFSHGDPNMERIPWDRAKYLMEDSISKVRRGEAITAPEVLRYAH